MSGVGAARQLAEELAKVIARRRAVIGSPRQLKLIGEKYGLSPTVTKQYIENDLALSIKRYKAVKDFAFKETEYDARYSDAPYTKAAIKAYKEKEQLRALAFTEPQLRGPQIAKRKEQSMNDLALQIEQRKDDLRLGGPNDPRRVSIERDIQAMEQKLERLETNAETPNAPQQKIIYSNNEAGQARQQEHVKALSVPVSPSKADATKPISLDEVLNPHQERYGLQEPPPAMVVHDNFMDSFDSINDPAVLEGMLKSRLQKQMMGGKDRKYSKYAMDQINKEIKMIREKLTPHTQKFRIDPAAEDHNLSTQWEGYAKGGLVKPYEHQTSAGQMSPALQKTLEARDYKDFAPPKGPKPDTGDRLLAIREGLGSIPGITAEMIGMGMNSPIAMAYDAATGSKTNDVVPEYFEQVKESVDQAYMSNPDYPDKNRSVHEKSMDEKVGFYGSWVADPLGWVGVKGGPALKKLKPKQAKRITDRINDVIEKMREPDVSGLELIKLQKQHTKLIDEMFKQSPIKAEAERRTPPAVHEALKEPLPTISDEFVDTKTLLADASRRDFMKQSAAATGVGAVGGIAGLKYMTKGAEATTKGSRYSSQILGAKPNTQREVLNSEFRKLENVRGMDYQALEMERAALARKIMSDDLMRYERLLAKKRYEDIGVTMGRWKENRGPYQPYTDKQLQKDLDYFDSLK